MEDDIDVLYVGPESTTAERLGRAARFDVTTAADAAAALDRLDGVAADCVVSRHRPPSVDGLTPLDRLRDERPGLPSLVVVDTPGEAVRDAVGAGRITDYLTVEAVRVGSLPARVETAVRRENRERTVDRERWLAEIVGTADVSLYLYTADWEELLFVNAAYKDVWGRSIADLYERPHDFLDAVHPDDRKRVEGAMERASAGESVDVEFRIHVEGDRRWLAARAEPVRDDAGEVVRIAGFVSDVTERKRRQRALERERDRYLTLFENLPNPVVHGVAEGGIPIVKDVNPAFEETFGYDAEAIRGERLHDHILPDGVDGAAALDGRILEEGEVTTEVRREAADGTRLFRLDVATRHPDDGPPEGYAMYTDITEREEHREALRRERDRLSALFEAVPQPVVHVAFEDDDPIVRRINEPFEAVFGYSEAEAIDESIDDLIVPDRLSGEAREINRAARENASIRREVRRETVDGEREFLFSTRLMRADGGDEALGIYTDITAQKRREKRLERQNERLDEYASVISHDLRNPLNLLSGALDLAEGTGDSEHFERARRAADRMDRLIDDLLTLARQGDRVDDPDAVDLARVVERSWEAVEGEGRELEVAVEGRVPADEGRLRRLFENLFRNSVEHGGDDVTVTVGDLPDGFYVADDGPGVPEADRDQVFDSGYSTADEGTGFGLAIVRRIAEAHGWEVRLTTAADGGARFEFSGVEAPR
ncbi:MAG: PAS domain S-box protein [Haloferacaceae archaeon]